MMSAATPSITPTIPINVIREMKPPSRFDRT
jgi:hypothetical protein